MLCIHVQGLSYLTATAYPQTGKMRQWTEKVTEYCIYEMLLKLDVNLINYLFFLMCSTLLLISYFLIKHVFLFYLLQGLGEGEGKKLSYTHLNYLQDSL